MEIVACAYHRAFSPEDCRYPGTVLGYGPTGKQGMVCENHRDRKPEASTNQPPSRAVTNFRSASASREFPYGLDTVPFILVKAGRAQSYAKKRRDKLTMLTTRGGTILAAWPGQWSTDVFVIDDRSIAKRVLSQSASASLSNLEFMEHHSGKHHAKASRDCGECEDHLNGKHNERPYAPDYCQRNSTCPQSA